MLFELRYAVRQLRKSPAFTIAAVLTLALGIGANTAIFSIINAVFLRPLPYPNSNRLAMLWGGDAKYYSFSYPRYAFLRDHASDFARVAAYDDEIVTFSDGGDPERIEGGFRGALVIGEVALSIALLSSASLLFERPLLSGGSIRTCCSASSRPIPRRSLR